MAYDTCIAAIIAASKGALDEDAIADLTDEIEKQLARRRRANPLESPDEAGAAIAKALGDAEKTAALIERRNRAINVLRKIERFSRYGALPGEEAKALHALNVGSIKGFYGAGDSVDAQRHAIEGEIMGGFVGELRQAGLLDLFGKGGPEFDRDVANELGRLEDGRFGRETGNDQAAAVAKIIAKYQELARRRQNQAGAWIRKMPGYVTRQSHDQMRIAAAGYDAWKSAILPRLDEATFDGVKDREAFLHRVYVGLSSGIHLQSHGAGDWLMGFTGPGNRAKSISQERVLHFRSADDWLDYNEQFGARSLMEAVTGGLSSAARNIALMRSWGTNPLAAFTADVDQLMRAAIDRGDTKAAQQLRAWTLRAEFDQINGTANIAGSPRVAQIGQSVRNWFSMSSLGGVTISSLSDVANVAATLRHNGVGYLEGIGNQFGQLMEGRSSGAKREIADLIGVGIDGIRGHIAGRFSATDNVPGRMSKLMDVFFRANLLTWWTDAMKTGVGLVLARNLAKLQATAFDGLPELLRTNLGRYRIDAGDWEALRKIETRLADSDAYLTPDMIADEGLRLKLQTYYADQVREAMTEAGAYERARITGGTSAGTAWGEAIRFLMQFKTFGITFATKHIAREWSRGARVDTQGLFYLMVGTTSLGYLSMSAKDLLKGRNPRDPNDPATWAAAMQQGGGWGIYGDLLFGKFNRFGGSPAATLGGPAVGKAEDLFRIYGALKDGQDVRAKLVKLGIDNTPFINLFYTRLAMDHLFIHQVQEAMNPGYLQRMEKRIKDENGQTFWLKPSASLGVNP